MENVANTFEKINLGEKAPFNKTDILNSLKTILCYSVVAFLMGRATAFGYIFPFSVAFVSASVNDKGRNIYLIGFSILGVFSNPLSRYCFIETSVTMISVAVIVFLISWKHIMSPMLCGIVSAIGTILVKICFCIQIGAIFIYDVYLILMESLLVMAFTYIFAKAINVVNRKTDINYTMETKAAVVISFAIALTGLSSVNINEFDIGLCGVMLMTIVASHRSGIAGGCITGIISGTIMATMSYINPAIIGTLGFSGLLGGFLRKNMKIYLAVCFAAVNITLIVVSEYGINQGSYYEVITAVVIFLILPEKILKETDFIFNQIKYIERHMENEKRTYVKNNIDEFKHAFLNLSEIFGRNNVSENKTDKDYIKEIMDNFSKDICKNCDRNFDCYEIYNGRTENFVKSIIRSQEMEFNEDGSLRYDKTYGFHCRELLAAYFYIRKSVEVISIENRWKRRMESSRDFMMEQFKGVAEALEKVGHETISYGREKDDFERVFDNVDLGVSKVSKDGIICGDSCMGARLNEKDFLIAISDGMGNGKDAAFESMMTINTLFNFLRAGFREEIAIAAMNSMLIVKSSDEIFSTVDLGIINCTKGILKFYKMGAANACIKRKDKIETIKKASLPIGIVEKVRVESIEAKVEKGDIIIMVSDGVTEANTLDGEAKWLSEYIKEIQSTNPQVMSDLIIGKAIEQYGNREKDDLTVLVAKLC